MLSAAFVLLSALPLTPNGKIDRKALPAREGHQSEECYRPPRDVIEQQLVQIWEALLPVRPIGIQDGFFDLAGHSSGARVAFQMAQILLAQRRAIGLLAMVDTYAPGTINNENVAAVDEGEILRMLLGGELGALSPAVFDGLNLEEQLAYAARRLEEANLWPEGYGTEHLRCLVRVYGATAQMSLRRSPASYPPLPITLLRASEAMPDQPLASVPGEKLGWSGYSSPPVAVHYLPGNHSTMMTPPHVVEVAKRLQQLMVT